MIVFCKLSLVTGVGSVTGGSLLLLTAVALSYSGLLRWGGLF